MQTGYVTLHNSLFVTLRKDICRMVESLSNGQFSIVSRLTHVMLSELSIRRNWSHLSSVRGTLWQNTLNLKDLDHMSHLTHATNKGHQQNEQTVRLINKMSGKKGRSMTLLNPNASPHHNTMII